MVMLGLIFHVGESSDAVPLSRSAPLRRSTCTLTTARLPGCIAGSDLGFATSRTRRWRRPFASSVRSSAFVSWSLRYTSLPSFPRKRESILLFVLSLKIKMDSRLRGNDGRKGLG